MTWTDQAFAKMMAVAEMLVNSVKMMFETCVQSMTRVRVGEGKPRAVRTISITRMTMVLKTETAYLVSDDGADALR